MAKGENPVSAGNLSPPPHNAVWFAEPFKTCKPCEVGQVLVPSVLQLGKLRPREGRRCAAEWQGWDWTPVPWLSIH